MIDYDAILAAAGARVQQPDPHRTPLLDVLAGITDAEITGLTLSELLHRHLWPAETVATAALLLSGDGYRDVGTAVLDHLLGLGWYVLEIQGQNRLFPPETDASAWVAKVRATAAAKRKKEVVKENDNTAPIDPAATAADAAAPY